MLVSLSLIILPLLDTFAHLVHLTLVSELPLSNSTRRKGRRARRFAACNRRSPHPREGGAISSLSSNGEPNKKNSTLLPSNSNSNETFSPPSKTTATVACLTLGRFVFTPQQRKASAKAGPPMQNGKTHKEAGDRLAEVRSLNCDVSCSSYLSLSL